MLSKQDTATDWTLKLSESWNVHGQWTPFILWLNEHSVGLRVCRKEKAHFLRRVT
jgi:hypothetical protein